MTNSFTDTTTDTYGKNRRGAFGGLFSIRGRIGRVRYSAYLFGCVVLLGLLMLLTSMVVILVGPSAQGFYKATSTVLYAVFLPLFVLTLSMRRVHDFNFGGWLALVALIPFASVIFCLIPGNRSDNDYGPAPGEEEFGMKLAAIALPALLIGTFVFGKREPLPTPQQRSLPPAVERSLDAIRQSPSQPSGDKPTSSKSLPTYQP